MTSEVPVEHEVGTGRDGTRRDDGRRDDDAGRTDVKVEIFIIYDEAILKPRFCPIFCC